MKGYKGFDKDLQCRGKQYEVGKTFKEKTAKLCKRGMHFCENPLEVFYYYGPSNGRFCEIEADGVTKESDNDTKRACTELTVKAEIGIPGIIKAGVEYIKSKVDWDNAKESNTGSRSVATNTGNNSAATNTGDGSEAAVEGEESVAIALGIGGKAKGAKGCWIVLAEWTKYGNIWHRKIVKSYKVDGKRIKANTFYKLQDGKAVETE